MALKEQDVVFTTKDSSGNTVIQMPITRAANVEDLTDTCLPLTGGTVSGQIVANGGVKGNLTGTADVATKVGTATVGSAIKPIYLNLGVATASGNTVGGTAKPMYLKAGEMTAISANVGSATLPMYLKAGTMTACGNSLAVSITGTAAKATADASGHTITSHYAPLASPALTGTPTAPTAAASVKNTQIATTAYVNNLFPTGTCICGLFKSIPAGWLSMDGSKILLSDYPDLVRLLWNFAAFKGDSSTYAYLPNMHHRFFEGTTTLSEVGTYVEAGLPNITGWLGGYGISTVDKDGNFFSGAISAYVDNDFAINVVKQTTTNNSNNLKFVAGSSNNIYGKSNTIQPYSIRFRTIVRT